ncbi:PREDICTED: aryl hydrocarbon receptor repressor-like, partial [Elephantulus edwardii]|uniref:aryl hydrocarbon receptor repressor-like n=1 Tax=Elephantulus edwardii TaxID=28737 RepID=UPI0003F08C83
SAVAPSLSEAEVRGRYSYRTGRSHGENGGPAFGAHMDTDRWAQTPARASCPCLGTDLILDPEGILGDLEEEARRRVLSRNACVRGQKDTPTYSCCLEVGRTRPSGWTVERLREGCPKPELGTRRHSPFPGHTQPRGVCTPYADGPGMLAAGRGAPFRGTPSVPPIDHPLNAHYSRTSRPWQDCDQALVPPPISCPFPQGSLGNGLPHLGAQRFPAGGYPAEDTTVRGAPLASEALSSPVLSLDVPIKVESEDTVDSSAVPPGQVWLGASELVKRQPASVPTRVHLKTEPDAGHLPPCTYTPHLGASMLGPHHHCKPPARTCPWYSAGCAFLEHLCSPLGPETPHHTQQDLGVRQLCTLRPNCRVPGAASLVKREPLDSPPWATHGQSRVPGMLPKGALPTMVPPKASEHTFLP